MTTKLTIAETAEALCISIKTVRRRIANKELKAEKVGNKWFVDISDQLRANEGQVDDQLLNSLRDEVKHYQGLLAKADSEVTYLRDQLERSDRQTESMSQQIDRLSQLLAVTHKSLQTVSEKYQLLEDKSRQTWWQKLWKRSGKSEKLQEENAGIS